MSTRQHATVSVVHEDPFAAGREAATELLDELGAPPDLVIVFASSDFTPHRVVEGLYDRLPERTRLVGCSSYAEIGLTEALTSSVTALGIRLGALRAHPFSITPDGISAIDAGRRLGAELAPLSPSLILLFPDVLTINATQLLLGLQEVLGKSAPIVGGASADRGEFLRTYQLCDRTVLSGGAVGVALSGPFRVVTGARSGYLPIGVPQTCTRVEGGNVVLEINGRPALQVYRDLLGERASEMPAVSIEFPIGVVGGVAGTQRQSDQEVQLVRAIFRVDDAREALVLGGDIPEGALIHATRATRADIIRSAEEATTRALAAMPSPDLALIFSCMSRKVVLGSRYKDECAAAFSRRGCRG